ncbi:MAG: sigma-70 family RNA polymerase sigma factor [Deltaproteobacteria bacterium]|nr:sigma-70 family RNA polymerase sigma factor [Deltaproteobacteria bacterium]PWB67698.1 MAG: RNA polymerase subunit sigma [Deltaproteobacteria bacterium]
MRSPSAGACTSRNGEEYAPGWSNRIGLRREDAALVEELRLGVPAAVEALFDRYHAKVYSLAMTILKNESDAEEVVQDVFLAVVRKADLFRGNSALYSWIYRICVNTCLMRLRKGKRVESVPIDDFLPVFTKEGVHAKPVQDWSREVERRLLDKELGQMISRFSLHLPEKYRTVFALCDVQGLSYEETAEVLDLTIAAVKSRLHRARLFLRERLGHYLTDGKMV